MNRRTKAIPVNLIDLYDTLPLHPDLRAQLAASIAEECAGPVPSDSALAAAVLLALHEAYARLPAAAAQRLAAVCSALAQRAHDDVERPVGYRRVFS